MSEKFSPTDCATENEAIDLDIIRRDREQEREAAEYEALSFGPFQMTPCGLWLVAVDPKTSEEEKEQISGSFKILGRARDPNGDDWARYIQFRDKDGREHRVAVKDADLHGDPRTLTATLA